VIAMEMKQKIQEVDESIEWSDILDIDTKIFREVIKFLQKKFDLKIKHKSDIRDLIAKVAMRESRSFVNFADLFIFTAIDCCCTPTLEQLHEVMFEQIFVRINSSFKDIDYFLKRNLNAKTNTEKIKAVSQQIEDFINELNEKFKKKSRKELILNNQLFQTHFFQEEVHVFLEWSEDRISESIIEYFKKLEDFKKILK
jgi:hypothetical protein